ncbi:hypothetical protein B484DRAFT_447454, partial [Ochromonadaceae sp. CCMP2298]
MDDGGITRWPEILALTQFHVLPHAQSPDKLLSEKTLRRARSPSSGNAQGGARNRAGVQRATSATGNRTKASNPADPRNIGNVGNIGKFRMSANVGNSTEGESATFDRSLRASDRLPGSYRPVSAPSSRRPRPRRGGMGLMGDGWDVSWARGEMGNGVHANAGGAEALGTPDYVSQGKALKGGARSKKATKLYQQINRELDFEAAVVEGTKWDGGGAREGSRERGRSRSKSRSKSRSGERQRETERQQTQQQQRQERQSKQCSQRQQEQ